jgi:hypothetical protein
MESTQIEDGSVPLTDMAYVAPVAVQRRLAWLHDVRHQSYPRISHMGEFSPIPFSTLRDIHLTGRIPEKWRKRLRIQLPKRVRIELPSDITDEDLAHIHCLSVEERARLLLKGDC